LLLHSSLSPLLAPPPPTSTLFPYTTLFRSCGNRHVVVQQTFQRRLRIGINFVHLEKIVPVFDDRATPTIACRPDFRRQIGRSISDRKSTRLNSSHVAISYAVFCLKKKKKTN